MSKTKMRIPICTNPSYIDLCFEWTLSVRTCLHGPYYRSLPLAKCIELATGFTMLASQLITSMNWCKTWHPAIKLLVEKSFFLNDKNSIQEIYSWICTFLLILYVKYTVYTQYIVFNYTKFYDRKRERERERENTFCNFNIWQFHQANKKLRTDTISLGVCTWTHS